MKEKLQVYQFHRQGMALMNVVIVDVELKWKNMSIAFVKQ